LSEQGGAEYARPPAILIVDESGSVGFANHQAAALFGYDREEVPADSRWPVRSLLDRETFNQKRLERE
jgi:PAS domain S-box-containing protein